MKRARNSLFFVGLMMLSDMFAVFASYIIAYILRVKISDAPIHDFVAARNFFWYMIWLLLPFTVIWFSVIGSYKQESARKSTQVLRLIAGTFGALMFMIFIDYFHNEPIFPAKLVPSYGFGISLILVGLGRGFLYLIRFIRRRRRLGVYGIMIIGDNDVARQIFDDIEQPNSGYKIHSVIGDRRKSFVTHKDFAEAILTSNPNMIIQIATPEAPVIDTTILDFAQKNFIAFNFVPSEINDLPDRVEIGLFMGNVPMMSVCQTTLLGWGRVGKRLFDLAVSGLGLVILSPIFLIIWILEKLFGGGSPIFHHTRLTRGSQKFELYKFRSQWAKFDNTTPEQAFDMIGQPNLIKKYRANGDKLDDDPRITKLGRFLRKTSLDELPQLWNVFKGDISLVGPRALIPEELNTFEKKHTILNVKSGITGLAQISGRRDLAWDQRRKLDVYYVQNWSFWLDLSILFRTFWQVLTGRGAK
ncbi:MAG: sugar transferase [Candidatus Nomurabacteria bacterium]|jgi:exopolysaccharide biosynthesis polyprenyl glycosylphosphotransferase|nr:sugar transferase [Candidatus Nomurabacteria bacterium]